MRTFWLSFFLLLGNLAFSQLSEQQFLRPDATYAPNVHWLWNSSLVNREGINLDLEALAATGLRGGSIDLYTAEPARLDSARWNELLLHALQQADRLELAFDLILPSSIGQGSIQARPEFGAQRLVWSETSVNGSQTIERLLPKPQSNPTYYNDVAVLAFPEGSVVDLSNIKNLSDLLASDGRLNWTAPKGNWTIVRFGCTLVDSISSGRLTLDAFSQQASHHYFDAVLKPIIEQTASFKGRSLTGFSLKEAFPNLQNWTPLLREEFLRQAGYDLTPFLLVFTGRVVGNAQNVSRFQWDLQRIQSRLKAANHVEVLQALLKTQGFQWKPNQPEVAPRTLSPQLLKAWSDHTMAEAVVLDFELLPYGQAVDQADSTKPLNRNNPLLGKYTNCFNNLKRFNYVLKHASPVYLGACFLGEEATTQKPSGWNLDCLSRNMLLDSVQVKNQLLALPDGRTYRFLVLADTKVLSLPLLRKLKEWLSDGIWLLAPKPKTWAGRLNPKEQAEWTALVTELWSHLPAGVYRFGAGRLFIDCGVDRVLRESGWMPDFALTASDSNARILSKHLQVGPSDAWFLSNRLDRTDTIMASFRTIGFQPEWWNPQTGEVHNIRIFRQLDDQTLVPLLLEPNESGFIVFRKKLEEVVYDAVSRDDELVFSADPNVFPDRMPANIFSTKLDKLLPTMLQQKEGLLVRKKGLYTLVQPGTLPKKQAKLLLKSDLPVYVLTETDTVWVTKNAYDTTTWRCRFSLTASDLSDNRLMLDLGRPSSVLADVFINGKSAGSSWTSPYRVEVTNLVEIGENSLEVHFVSTESDSRQTKMVQGPFLLSVWKARTY